MISDIIILICIILSWEGFKLAVKGFLSYCRKAQYDDMQGESQRRIHNLRNIVCSLQKRYVDDYEWNIKIKDETRRDMGLLRLAVREIYDILEEEK